MSSITSAGDTTSERTASLAALLDARQLACRRGDRLLFQGLDLQVQAGQILWIRGRNGCGKTSLLRTLAGLTTPESGSVQRTAPALYLAHSNALKEDLTVLESLRFLATLQGLPSASSVAALRAVGLHDRRHAAVRTLSQGQRRRVALARLFMQPSASLWILDEPFDALDAESTHTLAQALQAQARSGGAVVLTSHLELDVQAPRPTVLQLDRAAAA